MVSFSLAATVAVMASASLAQTIVAKAMTDMGCYKSSKGLTFNDTWTYQSTGFCVKKCVPLNKAVFALTAAGDCWCGDTLPPLDSKADSTKCDTPCNGWPTDFCGSADGVYFNLWNSGIKTTVLNYGASSSSSSDDTTSTSTAKPSVVTIGGQTQTITAASTPDPSSSGPNKAGIAAGVVVGVIAIAAIAGGAFFFMRRKQKREEEDEAKRQEAINSFMTAKPRSSGGMSSNDSRLDPIIMTRRQSDGSIMDNQDYSRRILKVTNA